MRKKSRIAVWTVALTFVLGGIGLYLPGEAYSDTKICPNSSVKCNVTFEHDEYGEITVESEKGENDSAIVIEKE